MTGARGERPRTIATAGHVDHGKSTLVRALTGTDPDRLAEEKRRGLTIDLGFAGFDVPGVGPVAVVDVPGHERFIATMLAGVAVIEAVVLCVDAGEGWRAQTEEHLRIVELAGIGRGVVALTKAATVGAARLAGVEADVRRRLSGSALDSAPVVACDAAAGTGLGPLVDALAAALRAAPGPLDVGRPRLWVDRSFAIAGAGAVVTGGVSHGAFVRGDHVEVVTRAGRAGARIRELQFLGAAIERAAPGSRAALNLAGASHRDVRRGDAVVRRGEWELVDDLEAAVDVLASAREPLRARGAHLAYVGSNELAVRLRVVGASRIDPGARGTVRLRLPRALPLSVGDRVVLRDASRRETVGGGAVTALGPIRRRRAPAAPTDRSLLDRVEAARPLGLDLAALDDGAAATARALAARGAVVVDHGYVLGPGWSDELSRHPFVAALRAVPFAPPPASPDRVAPAELRALARRRLVVGGGGLWFAADAIPLAADRIAGVAGASFTLADARDALGTSRRYALALCQLLDGAGITARHGDRRRFRVEGGRAPAQ
ncbi:MAG TPA: SelB C-terminal domain-containing protein [Acidimicrobiales bacterium]|nr:SelB C-terminal domain-containing protein [Acidimicrobiales bacterium]